MDDDLKRKRHGAGFWCPWIAGVLMLYVLSYGPMLAVLFEIRLSSTLSLSPVSPWIDHATIALGFAYLPLEIIFALCPESIQKLWMAYLEFWVPGLNSMMGAGGA